MTESIQYRLLIKQVIGRLLIDTVKEGLRFTLQEAGNNWRISVYGLSREKTDEIIELIDDLNFFYFEETTGDSPSISKWWLYDKQQPRHSYDEAEQRLELVVDSRVAYSNTKV
jgi:hypothetical protein